MSGNGGQTQQDLDQYIKKARETYDVVQSTDKTLLLDLDTPESISQFIHVFKKLKKNYSVVSVQNWKSKSGKDHVLLTITETLPPETRIGLQASLGSDGIKEMLSFKGLANGCIEPSFLFRPKDSVIEDTFQFLINAEVN